MADRAPHLGTGFLNNRHDDEQWGGQQIKGMGAQWAFVDLILNLHGREHVWILSGGLNSLREIAMPPLALNFSLPHELWLCRRPTLNIPEILNKMIGWSKNPIYIHGFIHLGGVDVAKRQAHHSQTNHLNLKQVPTPSALEHGAKTCQIRHVASGVATRCGNELRWWGAPAQVTAGVIWRKVSC